ncbi:hypothetical protein C2G38_2228954 [Gigaspora rosea]|uniref:Uncharacterized protein n=1 Tax=Gigaspora rosea TaxID=44941 RepID=A0A397TVA0_9GLOM|nr:hypothetical protein C2G38_2228954 [Gigaspora rosea]
MRQQNLTNIEIDTFEIDTKQWIKDFSRPTIGKLNSPNQQQGIKGLSLRLFSTSNTAFFSGTTMCGGKIHKPVVYDIMEYENRQIYYQIHNIPTTYSREVVKIKN